MCKTSIDSKRKMYMNTTITVSGESLAEARFIYLDFITPLSYQ